MSESNSNTKTTNYSNQHLTASTTVIVPPRYIGSVIGGGGKTIQEIKQKTHTKISHLYPDPHNGNLLDAFRISGSPHNVDQAQKWIRKVVANTWRKDNPNEIQPEKGAATSHDNESSENDRKRDDAYYQNLLGTRS